VSEFLGTYLLELLQKVKHPVQILGIVGQLVFFSRFALQLIESERRRESVIPIGFWWCSVVGGTLTLVYGLLERQPPVILGQLFGNVVYVRNLVLIYRKRRQLESVLAEEATQP
jgi:lipid-A-disaccharide synthase-like uncharacterized protein